MKLNKKTDYSLRILLYLLENPGNVKIQKIAEYYDISYNHLRVAANMLSELAIVASTSGPNGGISLKKESEELKLGVVVRSIENMDVVECFNTETNQCHITHCCSLQGILRGAVNSFIDHLNQYKLKDLKKVVLSS